MKKNLLLSLVTVVSISNFAQQALPLSKEKVIELYKNLYVTSEVDSIVWNGNAKKCECGKLEKEIYSKATDRVNFFRQVCGLDAIGISEELNKEAQDAALLIKANNQLTHAPSKSMKCYSESAANGCERSCLGFTDYKYFPFTSFITGFMKDYGASNYFVGHRKWILYTKLEKFGYGATNNTEALQTVNGVSYSKFLGLDFIPYPWNGYVPVDFIFPKWSFSIPENKEVDFSRTAISMTDHNGKAIALKKLKEYKNYLDHTIVWEATGLFSEDSIKYGNNELEENGYLNKKIKVRIRGVKVDGKTMNYEYFVIPFKVK
jgi:hypothetical protein